MTFPLKHTARVGSLLICTTLACSGALAQTTERPDLEGIWTNASLTSLNRRSGVEPLVVSPEEAQILAASVPIAGLEGGLDEGDGATLQPLLPQRGIASLVRFCNDLPHAHAAAG